MAGGEDVEIVANLQADVVEPVAFLARLEPQCSSGSRCPFPTRLVWRFVDVATATEQGLRLLNEARDGRRSNLATVVADVHADVGGRAVDEPDAVPDFIGRELRPQGFKSVVEAWFGKQVFPEVWQFNPSAFGIQRQSFAAELNRAGDEVAIGSAPVFVSEWIVPDVVHAAKHQAVLPVNLAVQVHAQPLRRQIIEQWFERVEIVIAKESEDRGLARAAHCAQVVGQHREKLALAVEAAIFGQPITGDQDEARLLLLDYAHEIAPLPDALVQVTRDDDSYRHRWG